MAQSLEKKLQEADVVIEGKVLSQEGFFINNKANIVTLNIIEVYKVFKGEQIKDTICLITGGGQVYYKTEYGIMSSGHSSSNYRGRIFEGTDGIFFLRFNDYYKLNEEDTPNGLQQFAIQSRTIKLAVSNQYVALEEGSYNNNYEDIVYKTLDELYEPIETFVGKAVDKRKKNRVELSKE